MGRHSAPGDAPSTPESPRDGSRDLRLAPVTNPILLDGLGSKARTGSMAGDRARPTTGQHAAVPQHVPAAAPPPVERATPPPVAAPRGRPAPPRSIDDDWDDEVDLGPLPAPVRASVAAAATAPVPLLQHAPATVTADVGDEDEDVLPAAPSITTRSAVPAGVRDHPLQISWPWFGVSLIAIAVLSIVAVLPI